MLNISLLALTLCGGVLVEPFRIADAEPGHHQGCLRAAMAPDGQFAVAWVDSMPGEALPKEMNVFIRFFNKDGTPKTAPYMVERIEGTNGTYWPCLDIDSGGNAVLAWVDNITRSDKDLSDIRFQSFSTAGAPKGSAHNLIPQVWLYNWKPFSLAGNNNGEFVVAWSTPDWEGQWVDHYYVWVQRFDTDGYPVGRAFMSRDKLPPDTSINDTTLVEFIYPEVTLNDEGDLVVTWLDFLETVHNYPRFQVFDADDNSILPWKPDGYRPDDDDSLEDACSPQPHWVDNDRFVVFWSDSKAPQPTLYKPMRGRLFREKGLSRSPIKTVMWGDSVWTTAPAPSGQFCTAVAPNDSFAYTHTRTYCYFDSSSSPWKIREWDHHAGFLGEVTDDEVRRTTTLFEYSPAWGSDTIWTRSDWGQYPRTQRPAVACSDDRIVWVYSRLNKDTTLEAWVMITDWNMGIGVEERPQVTHPNDFEIITSIGSQVVLRYFDKPEGLHAQIFDVTGRKVAEIHSNLTSGTIGWGKGHSPGCYFIVPRDDRGHPLKVVLVR